MVVRVEETEAARQGAGWTAWTDGLQGDGTTLVDRQYGSINHCCQLQRHQKFTSVHNWTPPFFLT